jgi:hypothetical protein
MKDKVTPSIPSSDEDGATPTPADACSEDCQRDLRYSIHLNDYAIWLIKLGYKITKVELPPKKLTVSCER